MPDSGTRLSRREFIGQGVASAVGVGLAAGAPLALPDPVAAASADKPDIADHRRLGRTDYKVSDIGFGNAGMREPAILEYAIERGINYIDTARQYFDMEKVIGRIFPQKRDKVFVTTKLTPELVTADVSVEDLMAAVEDSLQRLNTDTIDCCLIHSVGDPNLGDRTRIENNNIYTMFDRARKEGKIRYWGASAHGPKMVDDFNWLIDNTDIDMIMPGMNYMTRGLEPVLAKAKQKDIAVVAMKSMSAARKIDYSAFAREGRTVRQALLKWMLAQPNIDTIAISMPTFEDVDEFVAASGKVTPTPKEKKTMQEYGLLLDRDYCRPGCDGCAGSCPHDVPIHDILRYRLYFTNYGREKYALQRYASVAASRKASKCIACGGPCVTACPFGLPVRDKLVQAHAELTLG
ncbi:MAG: aldo/keto reductase [Candidatus Krumholzibacteria bacterium]|nr:aldo/keto reductase [Candidatus Krumholzibacteria bacterium]